MKRILLVLILFTGIFSSCELYDNDHSLLRLALASRVASNSGGKGNPLVNEPYVKTAFRDDFNGPAIDESVWQIATWREESQTSRDRCYISDGKLNLVFIYGGKDSNNNDIFNGAAIQTWNEFMYGKWEARLKPTSVSGVLNSMYTIDWDDTTTSNSGSDGTKQEIDIEFLTKSFGVSAGEVHYAVHATGKTSFNTNPDVSLGFNPSADFHVYGIDIRPDRIQWTVDGQVMREYIYAGNSISINAPYQLKFNVWSQNGATTWIGGPPPIGTECVYQIDWISFTPYN